MKSDHTTYKSLILQINVVLLITSVILSCEQKKCSQLVDKRSNELIACLGYDHNGIDSIIVKFGDLLKENNIITNYSKEVFLQLLNKKNKDVLKIVEQIQSIYLPQKLYLQYNPLPIESCINEKGKALKLDKEYLSIIKMLTIMPEGYTKLKSIDQYYEFFNGMAPCYFENKTIIHYVNYSLLFYYTYLYEEAKHPNRLPDHPPNENKL